MKKTVLFFVAALATQFAFSQITSTTHPWSGTNLNGTTYRNGNVEIRSSLPNGSVFANGTDRNLQCNVLRVGRVLSATGSLFNFLDFPQSNLNAQAQSFFGIEDRNYKSRFRYYANTGAGSEQLYYDKNQTSVYSLTENGLGRVVLKLPKTDSHVTIGTSSYTDGLDTYMLSVNGKVRAESVKVYTGWADFVFEKDYDLPTLEEVEEHINTHGHLKDIPSAKEVEENGIELGEMNKLLLQKIEELTLYTIQLKKEMELIKSKVK